MATIKEAFEYASKNPNSDFANNLKQLAASGSLDQEAQKYGIDLSYFKPKQEEPSLMDKLKGRANTIVQEASFQPSQEIAKSATGGADSVEAGGEAVLRAAQAPIRVTGAIGGAIGDVIGSGLEAAGLSSSATQQTPETQAIAEKYSGTGTRNVSPDTQQVFNAISDTANLPITGGVGSLAKTAAKTGTEAVVDTAKSIAGKTIKTPDQALIDLVTPELSKKQNLTALKTGKVAENKDLLGSRDITGTVQNFDEIKNAVAKVPGINPNGTNLENLNVIHNEIGTIADGLSTALGNDKRFFTPNEFKSYMSAVKKDLSESPLLVGDAEKSANKIYSKFDSLIKTNGYTPSGLLKARKELDNWISNQKGEGIFSPDKETTLSLVLRGIRQGGNNFLADMVPDIAVKDLLRQQSILYQAIENIAPKALKEGGNKIQRALVKNPRLQKALEIGATAAIGGGAAGVLLNK